MSRYQRSSSHSNVPTTLTSPSLIEIKSKFEAEYRRCSVQRARVSCFGDFHALLCRLHLLADVEVTVGYVDPKDSCLLPINNDDNFAKATQCARPFLRIILQRKGENMWEVGDMTSMKRNKFLPQIMSSPKYRLPISYPEDFRQVAQIIDVDVVPERCRRVRLLKHSGADKPLGFYIRDGTSLRVTPTGLEKVPGIFISRLVPGGLAESTGLLAVNDEVLEVNGIEVAGKSLDQVTDMMVANSSNLIVTVKPANQRCPLDSSNSSSGMAERGASSRTSQLSRGSSSLLSRSSGRSGLSLGGATGVVGGGGSGRGSVGGARGSDEDREDVSLLATHSEGVLHL